MAPPLRVAVEFINTTNDLGGVTECKWYVDNALVSLTNLTNTEIFFDTPGVYTIKMVATNGLLESELIRTDYITITSPNVYGDLNAEFDVGLKTYSYQEGNPINITADNFSTERFVDDIITCEWFLDDVLVDTTNRLDAAHFTVAELGQYDVKLVVHCSDETIIEEEKLNYFEVVLAPS